MSKKDYEVVKAVMSGGHEYGPGEVVSLEATTGDRLVAQGFVVLSDKPAEPPKKPGKRGPSDDGL